MTTAQVVETSVTVNNNGPIQDHVHPHDQTQPTIVFIQWIKRAAKQSDPETLILKMILFV